MPNEGIRVHNLNTNNTATIAAVLLLVMQLKNGSVIVIVLLEITTYALIYDFDDKMLCDERLIQMLNT